MTSFSSAEARPSLQTRHPSSSHGVHQRNLAYQAAGTTNQKNDSLEDTDIEIIDSRPVKRRKVSSSVDLAITASSIPMNAKAYNSNQESSTRYTSAPWLSIIGNSAREDSQEQSDEPPPLPARPWTSNRTKDTALEDGRPGCRVREDVPVPTTPDSMRSPAIAPKFEDKRQADYFLWTGKHQEDVLSDIHVKQGYLDRAPNPPEKELNTARATLYNAFKHRAGIENLSALFSLVLSQKDGHGAFSSASSFKGPPPRVTLTEAKRKAWITDLANPEVPLRRLSKTIPQGIRGHLLLEQSLLHLVPLSRAIWFAKCVGANEIRTLKRKGVTAAVVQGAEAKWLREWTINIEQFIEQIISQCGQIKWRQRIQYTIQLTARLYAENLLDRDHYLDWIIKSSTSASMNQWPFWLMMAGMYRLDLLSFRKRAKQLAEILVTQYNLACKQKGYNSDQLVLKIKQNIQMCFRLRPACFLMPDKWSECKRALMACINTAIPVECEAFETICRSNEQVMGGNTDDLTSKQPPHARIIAILDLAQSPFDVSGISNKLIETSAEQARLVRTCLEWAVSCHRTGTARVYLVARLLRKWYRSGFDTDNVLFDFLCTGTVPQTLDFTALRHMISELSRSQSFSISKLLQWLAVRGLPRRNTFSDAMCTSVMFRADSIPISVQICNDPMQILTEICFTSAGAHLKNTRDAMLSRCGFDTENEVTILEACRDHLSQLIWEPSSSDTMSRTSLDLSCLSWSIRTQLSHWLRAQMVTLMHRPVQDISGPSQQPGSERLNLEIFDAIRQTLEDLGDIAILADVLQISAHTKQEDLLATMVDTINRHSEALSAIGALEQLQRLYCQAYLMLRPVKTSMPLLGSALIDLCQQYPTQVTPVKALQQEFVRGDRGRAIAACSPFSDGVAESLQQAGATFYDDFEAILQTESNMNEQTMTRLFGVLVDRIMKTQIDDVDGQSGIFVLCQLLCRLKICRRLHGEMLMKKWLFNLVTESRHRMDTTLILNLISSRCVQLETLIDILPTASSNDSSKLDISETVRMAVLNQKAPRNSIQTWYNMKLAVSQLSRSKPAKVFEILGDGVTGNRLCDRQTRSLAIATILTNDAARLMSESGCQALCQKLSKALNNNASHDDVAQEMITLAKHAGPLSLPFCQFDIRMLCRKLAIQDAEIPQEEVVDLLNTCLEEENSHLLQSPTTFQALMQAMGSTIEGKLKWKVETTFFQALPKFIQSKPIGPPSLTNIRETELAARSALHRVLLVNANTTSAGQSGSVTALIEKLTIYLKYLGPTSASIGSTTTTTSPATTVPPSTPGLAAATMQPDAIRTFVLATVGTLDLLLQMVSIKRAVLCSAQTQPSPAVVKQNQQDQIKLLGLIVSIATQPVWTSITTGDTKPEQRRQVQNTVEMMFDVAATLVDEMADDPRVICMRLLKDKAKDERVKWLMGSVNMCGSAQFREVGHGLQLYHETKGLVGDFRPRVWEMLENGGATREGCLGLGLFGASEA